MVSRWGRRRSNSSAGRASSSLLLLREFALSVASTALYSFLASAQNLLLSQPTRRATVRATIQPIGERSNRGTSVNTNSHCTSSARLVYATVRCTMAAYVRKRTVVFAIGSNTMMAKETKSAYCWSPTTTLHAHEGRLGKILDTGDEVGGVRGRAARHEGAGAVGLQRAAAAKGGRYDTEALRSP